MTWRDAIGDLPAPQGADLITNLATFGQAPVGESLLKLFGALAGQASGRNITRSIMRIFS